MAINSDYFSVICGNRKYISFHIIVAELARSLSWRVHNGHESRTRHSPLQATTNKICINAVVLLIDKVRNNNNYYYYLISLKQYIYILLIYCSEQWIRFLFKCRDETSWWEHLVRVIESQIASVHLFILCRTPFFSLVYIL